MNKRILFAMAILGLLSINATFGAAEDPSPFIGRWALTIPGGGAGWLSVEQKAGYLDGSILWGGGSVVPLANVCVNMETLVATRVHRIERKDSKGKVIRIQMLTETILGRFEGDNLKLWQILPNRNGIGAQWNEFSSKRIPPLPPKPDLSRVKYGNPIVLFDGKNMDGWKLTNPGQTNGWSVEDGALVNKPVQEKGKPHISYGNLRTKDDDFEDFNLKLEVNVPKGGNSGIYLRGIYEVQVSDSFGKSLDAHNMGGIYSRIKPTVNAEKPAGQWQSFDITLLDRHVTVKLNGKTIIDNEPLLGCTGGALWSDESRPGPIYLQGDHSAISYRNIVLTPIIRPKVNQTIPVLFEDGFEGQLAEGWSWLRENPEKWRIKDGGLEICAEPGAAHNVKNALLFKAPDRSKGKFVIDVTVANHTVPTQQYEQAGITWYRDGKPVFKLVKELVDGQLMIIPGRKPMTSKTVQLRLIVDKDSFVAQYRPDGKGPSQTAAEGKLPLPLNDQVSIQCYHGPPNAEHWIRFDDFRVLELPE